MTRELRYQSAVRALRALLAEEAHTAGSLLPSEAELAARLGASRVTVRRALAILKDERLVDSRQGFGWFVVGAPLPQTLDRLTTVDAQIEAGGRRAERELLTFEIGRPPRWVAEELAAHRALHVVRLNRANGEPIGRNSAWAPADLAADITLSSVERQSLHHLLPVRPATARQTITALGASADDAALLRVPDGCPLLCARRVTYDADGRVILVSEAVYNPLRTEYVADLTSAAADTSGLRLIS